MHGCVCCVRERTLMVVGCPGEYLLDEELIETSCYLTIKSSQCSSQAFFGCPQSRLLLYIRPCSEGR